jgi:hypothetical protein
MRELRLSSNKIAKRGKKASLLGKHLIIFS